MEFEFRWRQVFEILIIHKPSLGSLDRKTNKHTDRQAKFIYRLNIEYNFFYRPATIHILLVLLTGVVFTYVRL